MGRKGAVAEAISAGSANLVLGEEALQGIEIRQGAERAESRKDHRQLAGLA